MLGYESVNGGKRLLYDGATLGQCESFIYGGAITLEAETYLSDRLVLLLRLRERILLGQRFHACPLPVWNRYQIHSLIFKPIYP